MSRIARPPLLARLDAVLDHRLLLLLVPEGATGPILLRRWAARRRPPSTWLSLCESDNQPERLLAHLVEALRPVAEAAGVRLAPPGAPVAADLESGLVDLINTLLEIRHETVLVLRNYHSHRDAGHPPGAGDVRRLPATPRAPADHFRRRAAAAPGPLARAPADGKHRPGGPKTQAAPAYASPFAPRRALRHPCRAGTTSFPVRYRASMRQAIARKPCFHRPQAAGRRPGGFLAV